MKRVLLIFIILSNGAFAQPHREPTENGFYDLDQETFFFKGISYKMLLAHQISASAGFYEPLPEGADEAMMVEACARLHHDTVMKSFEPFLEGAGKFLESISLYQGYSATLTCHTSGKIFPEKWPLRFEVAGFSIEPYKEPIVLAAFGVWLYGRAEDRSRLQEACYKIDLYEAALMLEANWKKPFLDRGISFSEGWGGPHPYAKFYEETLTSWLKSFIGRA